MRILLELKSRAVEIMHESHTVLFCLFGADDHPLFRFHYPASPLQALGRRGFSIPLSFILLPSFSSRRFPSNENIV